MKKVLSIFLSLMILMNCITGFAKEANEMSADTIKIYVSPSGDDKNTGDIESPLKTLANARDMARGYEGMVEIILRGGEYVLDETLVLNSQDGYTKWTSYENEEAIITSAERITGWVLHDSEKNIYKAEATVGFDTRQLYFNGEKARRSRSISYNGGYSNLKRTCELGLNSRNNKELYFYRNEVDNWNNFEDVEVHLLTAWTDNLLRLKKYDAEKNFKEVSINNGSEGVVSAAAIKLQEVESERIFNRAHPDITGSTRGYASRSYYYFENAYEFIDEDTEWYFDKGANTIYFKAPKDCDMSTAEITVPKLETLVKIEGNRENKAENISFENICFECTTWTRPNREGIVGGQGGQNVITCNLNNEVTVYHPASAFEAIYADNLLVTGCTFRNIGATALDFYYGVTNSQIFENEVYSVAGNGISVAKFTEDEEAEIHEAYNPHDKTEICKNIDIVNNRVHHIGTEYEGAVGIIAGYSENIVIAHNDIYDTPYSGISVGFGWTSKDNAMKNNVIFANRICDIGKVLCDFGAIYTLSKQPGSVCARNYINNVGRQAWFDYGYAAMYFDEQTEGYTIKENVMCSIGNDAWGGGINFNGCASKNTTKDNYINKSVNTDETTLSVYEEAGVRELDCSLLVKEAEDYLDKIINPEEPYDRSDYVLHTEIKPVKATATRADGGSDASYAIDKNENTAYTLSGQSEANAAKDYLLIELDGKNVIEQIKIDRQYHAGGIKDYDYWADWCLAVGCELQGSMDGEEWETIGVMNTWPDGVKNPESEIFNLESPKAYKYVRYIRMVVKKSGDYGYWLWSSSDGGNRLNVKEISFYGAVEAVKLEPLRVSAAADDGSDAAFATDGDNKTVYTLSNQTEKSIDDEYLLLELDGKRIVDKIIIRRQFNAANDTANNYWADWCLAVGCEVQGSMDGESWETIGVMNTWPDGTGEKTKEIFELDSPKAYKYVRYIRTQFKTGSDYAVWKFPTDGGNRLNVKEIELYTSQKMSLSNIERAGEEVKVRVENVFEEKGVLLVACCKEDTLLDVAVIKLEEGREEYETPFVDGTDKIKAMVLDLDHIEPLCKAMEKTLEE